jgi:hypothetical protein
MDYSDDALTDLEIENTILDTLSDLQVLINAIQEEHSNDEKWKVIQDLLIEYFDFLNDTFLNS